MSAARGDATLHLLWACVSAACLAAGFALTPVWYRISPYIVREADRPLRIDYCRRSQETLEMTLAPKSPGGVSLNLRVDPQTGRLRCITVYGSDDRLTLGALFHENGVPSELSTYKSYILKYSVGFHENGNTEFTSTIEKGATRSGACEHRQYYDPDGNPAEKRLVVHHCAD